MTANATSKKAKKKADQPSSPGVLSVEDLTEQTIDSEPYEIENLGTVIIRGLNREEAHEVANVDGSKAREARIVLIGVAEPRLTIQQVNAWMTKAPAGQIQAMVERINTLSGLDDDAEKEAVERFRE